VCAGEKVADKQMEKEENSMVNTVIPVKFIRGEGTNN
jgi:hypothetical protein